MSIVLVPGSIHNELVSEAKKIAPTAQLFPYAEDDSPVENLDQADAILRWVMGNRFSNLVEQGPKIRWLHTASAGVDHVLTPAVRNKVGITVTDSGPAFEIAIPEFVLAWMLMVARRLPDLIASQKVGKWQWVTQRELHGATVGIIGLGPIGQSVAKRAKAFGMKTLGLRRKNEPVEHVDQVLTGEGGLYALLSQSDYVVIAAALTPGTKSMIGASQLEAMKPDAWIINIARGAMIDEPALINWLLKNANGGACLDVFAKEPLPSDSPLWTLPNVYIAPHNSGGGSDALRSRQKALFLENLRRFENGEALESVVSIEAGY
jgi:phosphoglycerate dehydrogenase-like enzyme